MTYDETMQELHRALAAELLNRVLSGEAKPSDLNVARQFLKDNEYQAATPQANPALMRLAQELPFGPEAEAV